MHFAVFFGKLFDLENSFDLTIDRKSKSVDEIFINKHMRCAMFDDFYQVPLQAWVILVSGQVSILNVVSPILGLLHGMYWTLRWLHFNWYDPGEGYWYLKKMIFIVGIYFNFVLYKILILNQKDPRLVLPGY